MNQPEYILEDEIGTLVANASTALIADGVITTAINYQYGYFDEVKTMLAEYSKTAQYSALKYPLVWLVQPFTEKRDNGGYYSDVSIRLLIIKDSDKAWTYAERMTNTIKPVLLPIYRELLNQILSSTHVFEGLMNDHIPHKKTKRPYWGEDQQKQIDDVFDCIDINDLELKLSNNPNCTIPTKFFN